MTLPRPCLDCGRIIGAGSRCQPCLRESRTTKQGLTHTERKRRAQAVAEWRAKCGDVCPGYGRPGHVVVAPNILTADHVTPVAAGGPQNGPLRVLCRECNGRRGARA